MKAKYLTTAVIIALLSSMPVMAHAQPKIVLRLTQAKETTVIDEDGNKKTEWKEVDTTNPGDVLKYTIRYTNEGDSNARGAAIVDPVPEGTTYIGNSAKGEDADIQFSLDGKSYHFPPMLTYKVRQSDGIESEHRATPEMYTHIRWKLMKSVPVGGTGTLSFKARVN